MGRVTLRLLCCAVTLTLAPAFLHAATPAGVADALARAKSCVSSKSALSSSAKAPDQTLKSKASTVGSQWGGQPALAAYALLAAGDYPNARPKLAETVAFLKQAKLTGTSALGIRCLVWSRLPQTPDVKA